jgi:M6 family metalloprotease-like protein
MPLAVGLGKEEKASSFSAKGLSVVMLSPQAAKALRDSGRQFHYTFPNSLNKGKKFNPAGDLIPPLVTKAEQKVLVIFVQFTTLPPGGPTTRLDLTYFDNMLFGTVYDPTEYAAYLGHPTDRTLYNYFKEVSYGAVDVVTINMPSSLGWYSTGRPYDFYCRPDGIHDYGFGFYPQNAQGLVVDAVNAVDGVVDFSEYAVNGAVPNLFVVFAGTGAEWSSDPSIIWSHSWDLSSYTGFDGIMRDGVKINNYAMMPEVGGDLTGYLGYGVIGPFPPTVGVYAHEYGHVLGLPDQYDYGYESNGTGMYSLMASGSWNQYPANSIFAGNSPAHLDAWSKYRLGFITPSVISSSTDVSAIPPAETNPIAYKMIVPNSGGKEYFLFENRQNIGFDKGLWTWVPGAGLTFVHGLAIYHIDDTVLTRNYWNPNEAENWKEFRSEGWRKAWTGETHYGISIIQADDRWDPEHSPWEYGDPADLYPGSLKARTFGNETRPNSSNYYFWAGSSPKFGYSEITLTDIFENCFSISASFSFVPWKTK